MRCSRRTSNTIGLVTIVMLLAVATVAAVDSSQSIATFVKDAALLVVQGAVPILGLMAFGLRWGDWRPSGDPLEAEREHQQGIAPSASTRESRIVDVGLDEDFDALTRETLADGLPQALALVLLHDVRLVFAAGRLDGELGLRWLPSVPGPAGGPPTGHRIVLYRDSFRERFGGDLPLLRTELTREVRACLAHHVEIDLLWSG